MWHRKAQENIVETVIYVVIGLVVILSLIVLGVQVYRLTQTSQGSKVSFDRLSDGIQVLIDNTNVTLCHVTVSFDDHEALVGFNQNEAWATRAAFLHTVELARPVEKCPVAASCLVLCNVGGYTEDTDCSESYLYDAQSYEGVKSFEYIFEFDNPVPLFYYGSDGTVEQVSLKKRGESGNYVIELHNTDQKLSVDQHSCEFYRTNQGLPTNITTFS